jgi:putative DNA primase/helicase
MNEIYHEPKINSTIGISPTFNLTASDIEYRSKSFLNEQALKLAGLRRVSEDVAHQILGKETRFKDVEYAGLGIPYFQYFEGSQKLTEWTIRRDVPDYDSNGAGKLKEKRKYIKPPGVKNQLYIPPMMPPELLQSDGLPIVFCEGELKATALARVATNDFTSDKWSFIPLGLSGVDNFKKKGKADTPHGVRIISEELTDFQKINFGGANVCICFDSDLSDKPTVKAARGRLSRFLKEKGAKVFHLNFPKVFQGVSTKGVDDYLGAVEHALGKERAIGTFLELLEKAQKPKKPTSPVTENFELIEHGEERAAGVYYTDENGESFRVCSPLKIVAETQTERGEHYGRLIEWRDSQNRLHRWAMPIEFLHSTGSKLAEYLASNGLEIMPSRKHHEKLAFYIATAAADKTFISTDKIGLHGECFILPDETFGFSENEIIYQTEFDGHHNFRTAGTLDDWQNNISKYCRNNSRLLLAVSSAFAAPLLPVVQMQGGGFHFRGATSTGKTTAVFVGGSVCGGDSEHGFLQTWKATANGLEIVAAGHNHSLLCLDEIGECESREIGNVAYMLGNGRGKTRMTKTIQARHSLSWNLMFLSTGEQRLSDKIAESGGTVKGGQEIRLCDIEADTDRFGLFEGLHHFPNGQAFSDYLRAASCSYYGTALRAFLTWLVESDFDEIRTAWHDFKELFINSVLPDRAKIPSEVLRVAARFALVAFGGEMATQAGVTLWKESDATEALKTVFLQWLGGREGNGQSDIERGIRQVRKYIQNYEQSRFQKLWSTDEEKIIERVGFVRRNDDAKREFLIFPDDFKSICKGFDPKAVANAMKDKNILQTDGAGKTTKGVKIGGKNQRFYVITERIFTFDEAEEIKTVNA